MQSREEAEMLNKHDQLLNEQVMPRLESLEKAQAEQSDQLQSLQTDMNQVKHGQTQLENTLMKEGQKTRDSQDQMSELLNKFVTHYFKQDEQEQQAQSALSIQRLTTREKIIVGSLTALAGSGGLLAGINAFMQWFGQ